MRNVFPFVILILILFDCKGQIEKKITERPNIVFIMSDDHASEAIGCYNGFFADYAKTPNIDKLANTGMLFNNVICTNAICGPSRAAILTGKYSHLNGFYKNVDGGDFDGSQQTFPKLFQQAGYQTALIGKWHLGTVPTGFDYSQFLVNHGQQGTYYDAEFLINGSKKKKAQQHVTSQIAEDAIDWLTQKRDKAKPFMLCYQFKAPHRPWDPAPEFENLYNDITIPEPPTFNDTYKGRKAAADTWMTIENHLSRRDLKMKPPTHLTPNEQKKWFARGTSGEYVSPSDTLTGQALKKWKYQVYIKDYLRCVAGVDKAIGKMVEKLKEQGLYDNTIIIYTSDQGFFLGDHGWFDKRFMYEHSSRMPFIISYPEKIKPKSKNDNLYMNVDFAPTLLDLAGIDVPEDMQGISMKPTIFKEDDAKGHDAIYSHYYEWPIWHHVQPHYGIRTDRYKLIHFYHTIDEWELYDLQNDPNELNNLIDDADYSKILKSLKKTLREKQVYYKDNLSLDSMRKMTDQKIKRNIQRE
ncbi:sulfatase [uncultured Polaribacter sp.]|uniref:sulfatase family protein n=1 Tax=uncultured Polaribacter sp. TaxID=174711 RepID=UPI002623BF94|nr:sulfatase [uncultured Polaribacter sp.]